MIPKYSYEMWRALAPALGDHLWQSTLFAVTAGLLTLILRKNHARARYWLWLAVSMKFLIPFSLLVGLGSHLSWSRSPAGPNTSLYVAMEEVSQPFTQSTMPVTSAAVPATMSSSLGHLLPAFLVAVWLFGFALVLSVWCVRWRKMAAAMREALPLHDGREVEALRRIERIAGTRRIEILKSSASLEPGIFGITSPTLVWPEGISEHLEDAHLEAILAHEVWHVRRRDNLAAAMHMVVEAIFWFHPLVWWVGIRLVDERERACDEEVLELGSERQIYAESILKTCEFCVGSPLACVSGITGADLKNRIVHIMTHPVTRKLDFRKKLILGAAGLLAVAVPITFGLARAPQDHSQTQATNTPASAPVYEVASIKPDKSGDMRFKVMNTPDGFSADSTLQMLIRLAYGVEDNQISGAPNWVNSDRYDIEAKMDGATADEVRKLSGEQNQSTREHMLQALLVDRFKLTLHRETRELPLYSLVVAKNGSKLQESKPGEPDKRGFKTPDGHPMAQGHFFRMGMGQLDGHSIGTGDIARVLAQQLGRKVVDNTGLTANYDFTLKWTPEEGQGPAFREPEAGPGAGSTPAPETGPSIFTALQEQLGLKLESQKGPVEILVIDHVEKPSEN